MSQFQIEPKSFLTITSQRSKFVFHLIYFKLSKQFNLRFDNHNLNQNISGTAYHSVITSYANGLYRICTCFINSSLSLDKSGFFKYWIVKSEHQLKWNYLVNSKWTYLWCLIYQIYAFLTTRQISSLSSDTVYC